MDKFITVVEPKVQESLASLGFTYIKQTEISGKTVYAFAATEKLRKYLTENYTDADWHYTQNLLCF